MERRSRPLIVLSCLVALAAVLLACWALFPPAPEPLAPDQAPPSEEYALPSGEDTDEKMDQPPGGGSANLTYSNQVTVTLSDGMASLFFQNPSRSNQSVVLQVVVQDQVILQSGTLRPGTQLPQLPLRKNIRLSPGGYQGKFNVLFYHPETGSRATLNTEIPISIKVTP